MYILFETVASNDPRLTPNIQHKANAWLYSIAFVNPDSIQNNPISWLNPVELTEEESHCHRFLNVIDGEIPVMVNKKNPADLVTPTSYGDNDYEKQIYKLTASDLRNTVSLMKKIMKLHTEHHQTDATAKSRLLAGISTLTEIKETQMFMATYFEWECAYTATQDKVLEFPVSWSWETIIGDQPEVTGYVIPEGALSGNAPS